MTWEGGANPKEGDLILKNVCCKLHENERLFDRGKGVCIPDAPLGGDSKKKDSYY